MLHKKKRQKHHLLTGLLVFCMIWQMIPATVSAAGPTEILVNGEDILAAEDYTLACGKGTAVYDPADNTLTLTNAELTQASQGSPQESVNDQGAVKFDGDLNIILNGNNTIQSDACGIVSTDAGTLTVTGEGTLKIDAKYFGIREGGINSSQGGGKAEIVIDGAKLDIDVAREGSFAGTGIQAEGSLQIKNGASVEATGDDTGVNGNAGIYISDSTVNAYATETEGYQAIVSDNSITITNSVIDTSTASKYGDPAI